MKQLDIAIPCFNEQECVRRVFAEISRVMSGIPSWSYTVLFIDDGSRDKTLLEIKALIRELKEQPNGQCRVEYISFSRNFGKEAAIYAGLQNSHGDAIVFMDADLQDPPELLLQMIEGLEEGFDCVAAQRTSRKGEPVIRSWFANKFYALMNKFSDVTMNPGARDFRMMSAHMRDALLGLCERERFSKGLFAWVGFNTKWIEFPIVPRAAGTTKWSFFALYKYALSGIVGFTTAPLKIAASFGLFTVLIAIAYFLYRVLKYGFTVKPAEIAIVLILFFSGVIILFLGVIGEYLSRIYSEVKQRPIYITREKSRLED